MQPGSQETKFSFNVTLWCKRFFKQIVRHPDNVIKITTLLQNLENPQDDIFTV